MMHTLIYILQDILHIRDSILYKLSASDCASLLAVANYRLDDISIKKFLNPLRDILPDQDLIELYNHGNYDIILIGKDLDHLLQRITDPIQYYKLHEVIPLLSIFCIVTKSVLNTRSSTCYSRIQVLCPWISEYDSTPSWNQLRSSTDDRISILHYGFPSYFTRELKFDIGVKWTFEMTSEYSTNIARYDELSMNLVSKSNDEIWHTKYLELSRYPYQVKEASSKKLSSDMKMDYRYAKLNIYQPDGNTCESVGSIEFPIGQESPMPMNLQVI